MNRFYFTLKKSMPSVNSSRKYLNYIFVSWRNSPQWAKASSF